MKKTATWARALPLLRINVQAYNSFDTPQSIKFECLQVNLRVGCTFLPEVKAFKQLPSTSR